MNPVHFYWCRSSLKMALVFAAFLCLLGLPALTSDDWDMRLLGLALALGFMVLANSLAGRIQQTGPVITVDEAGLVDRRITALPFGWDEIRSVEALEIESTHWIGLEFADPRRSLAKAGWLVRGAAPLQRLMGLPRVTINMTLLDGTAGDLVTAIRAARPGLVIGA